MAEIDTPTTPWGVAKLPVEIFYAITDEALASWTRNEVRLLLRTLCFVNRRLRQWCQPRLFRQIDIELTTAPGIAEAFRRNPALASAVTKLKIWGLRCCICREDNDPEDFPSMINLILGSISPMQIQKLAISGSNRTGRENDYTMFQWRALDHRVRLSLERLICESRSLRRLDLSEGRGVPFYLVFSPTLHNVQLFNATIDLNDYPHQSPANVKQLELITPTNSLTFHHFAEIPILFDLRHLTKLTIDLRDGRLGVLAAILDQCGTSLEEICWKGSRWLSEGVSIDLLNCSKLRKLTIVQPLEHIESKRYPSTFSLLERLGVPPSLEVFDLRIQYTRPYSDLPPQMVDGILLPHLIRLDRSFVDDRWQRLKGVTVELGLPDEKDQFSYALPLQGMSHLLERGILLARLRQASSHTDEG